MLRPTLVAGLLLLVAMFGAAAEPLRYQPRMGKPLRVGFDLIEGGICGVAVAKEVKEDNASRPQSPKSAYIHCIWDGKHLVIRPGQVDKSMWSKDAIAKSGWYVTADYTKDPPQVIVTERPTDGSNWSFVAASNRAEYYIRNEGRSGKEAWLTVQPRETLYRSQRRVPASPAGSFEYRQLEVTVFDALLTFDGTKKQKFEVADIEAENGK
jgi:hypothetical protein